MGRQNFPSDDYLQHMITEALGDSLVCTFVCKLQNSCGLDSVIESSSKSINCA